MPRWQFSLASCFYLSSNPHVLFQGSEQANKMDFPRRESIFILQQHHTSFSSPHISFSVLPSDAEVIINLRKFSTAILIDGVVASQPQSCSYQSPLNVVLPPLTDCLSRCIQFPLFRKVSLSFYLSPYFTSFAPFLTEGW